MCSHSQLSSRIALIIGAWMPGLETPQQFHHQDSLCETFSKTWKRINQPRISQEVLLFLSTNPNFWVRKYGAVSLVNETFENVRSLPSTRVNRGARQVNPRRLGILSSLLQPHQDQGCAGVRIWLALDQDLESSTWGSAKSFYAGTQAGSWTALTQKTGDLCRSLQCQEQIKGWGHAGVERFTLPRQACG